MFQVASPTLGFLRLGSDLHSIIGLMADAVPFSTSKGQRSANVVRLTMLLILLFQQT